MKFLARSYKVPCRQTITNKLRGRFSVLMGIAKGRLAVDPHFAVTADLWTDLNQRSNFGKSTLLSSDELLIININFVGMTVHFLEDFVMRNVPLSLIPIEGSHTGEKNGSYMSKVLDEWNVPLHKVSILMIVSSCEFI